MTMSKVMTPMLAVMAFVIAYPWAVVLVPIIVIGLIRNPGPTIMLVVVIIAVTLGLMIVAPGLVRLVSRCQRAWARLVFELWKMLETRRTVSRAERNVRATVATESDRPSDLGSDPDAA